MHRDTAMSDEVALFETTLQSLPLLHRGKVRDIYAVDDDKLLIIQTDRLSAFDVILPTPVPGKGKLLTSLSSFWFEKLAHIIPNHLTGIPQNLRSGKRARTGGWPRVCSKTAEAVANRSHCARLCCGFRWKDYKSTGMICGIQLPAGLRKPRRLPDGPIFTPSTKAAQGAHDENIPFAEAERMLGKDLAEQVQRQGNRVVYGSGGLRASPKALLSQTPSSSSARIMKTGFISSMRRSPRFIPLLASRPVCAGKKSTQL